MDQEKIGKFIAKNRKKKKLTQAELAEKLGVSEKSVSNWENGRNMPDLSLFKPLCDELDISINDLMSGEKIDKSKYQEKFEENIINTIDYDKKTINKNDSKYSLIVIIIGIIISFIFLIFYSRLSIVFVIFGSILSLIGFTKRNSKHNLFIKIVLDFFFFLLFIVTMAIIDNFIVVNFKRVPVFYFDKHDASGVDNGYIYYRGVLSNVWVVNPLGEYEYIYVDPSKDYKFEHFPHFPYNKNVSGINELIKYKSKSLNLESVNGILEHLPLSSPKYQIYNLGYDVKIEDGNKLIINYHDKVSDFINTTIRNTLERDLLYNTVSMFLLIDDLDYIEYNIFDTTFMVNRESVEKNYPGYININRPHNFYTDRFEKYVEEKMINYDFVSIYYKEIFINSNISLTKKIIVKRFDEHFEGIDSNNVKRYYNEEITKTITDEKLIKSFGNIVSNSICLEKNALVTMEGTNIKFTFLDENDNELFTFEIFLNGSFGSFGKRYKLNGVNSEEYTNIINKMIA